MGGQRLRGAPHGPGAAATCRYPPGRAGQGRAGLGSAPPAPSPPCPIRPPRAAGGGGGQTKSCPPGGQRERCRGVPPVPSPPFLFYFFLFFMFTVLFYLLVCLFIYFSAARGGQGFREVAATVVSGESWRPGGVRRKCCGRLCRGSFRYRAQGARKRAPNRTIPPQIAAARPAPSPRGDTRGRNNARGLVPVIPGAAHFVSLAAEAQLCQDSWGSSRKRFRYPRSACLATPLDLCSLLVPAADTRDDRRGIKY